MKSAPRKITATIEARLTSERLPGKVMLPVCGKPLLAHLIDRLKRVRNLDSIVVATTTNAADDPIVHLAQNVGVDYFRGSEEDVLTRVLGAAQKYGVDIIVEITGDCPVIDPHIVEIGIDEFLSSNVDYISNIGYPGGMNYQIFATKTLAEVESLTREDAAAREHVSLPIYENPQIYKIRRLSAPLEHCRPEIFIELDEPADYEFIQKIYDALYPVNPMFNLSDILSLLDSNPGLTKINAHVRRRTAR
jgi:spore coat polysaccharide biosynthesis protein SpsF